MALSLLPGRLAVAYLRWFQRPNALPAIATVGPPEIGGRFFYKDDLRGFNFRQESVQLGAVLDYLRSYCPAFAPSR